MLPILALGLIAGAQAFGGRDYHNDARFYGHAGYDIYSDGHYRSLDDLYDYGYSSNLDGNKGSRLFYSSNLRDGYHTDASFNGRARHGIYRDGHDQPIADLYEYGYSKFDDVKRGGRTALLSDRYEPLVSRRGSTLKTYPTIDDYSRGGDLDYHYDDARFYDRDVESEATVVSSPPHISKNLKNPPVRYFMDDPNIKWRDGKPDFCKVDEKYMKERTKMHPVDSIEKLVENLVKTWEMEMTYKVDLKDFGSIVPEVYQATVNGNCTFDAQDNLDIGNYNMLMKDSPLYEQMSREDALETFKCALPGGFPWEVLEVLSGPPNVAFTWRHWADWTGPYKDVPPTGERITLIGSCIATVNDQLKITDLQVYYDPNPMMAKLQGWKKGEGCPFAKHKKDKYEDH